jgi:hypothetical protein
MFLLQFIPDWFFYITLIISLLVLLITKFITTTYTLPLRYASLIVTAFSLFLIGANWNNSYWLAKVKEVELQLAQAQAQSASENTKIVERVVTRRELVRVQGSEVIKYVDREVVKYDDTCKIPTPVVEAHNRAAKTPETDK